MKTNNRSFRVSTLVVLCAVFLMACDDGSGMTCDECLAQLDQRAIIEKCSPYCNEPMDAGAQIDGRVAGDWTGHFGSGALDESATTLRVVVDGAHAVIRGVCPIPDAAFEINGSGDTLFWDGDVTCGPISLSWCSQGVTITWTSAVFAFSVGSTLDATFEGIASGCGVAKQLLETFHSSR